MRRNGKTIIDAQFDTYEDAYNYLDDANKQLNKNSAIRDTINEMYKMRDDNLLVRERINKTLNTWGDMLFRHDRIN